MTLGQLINSLQLKDHFILNDQIEAVFPDDSTLVVNHDFLFSLKLEASRGELKTESISIN